MYIITKRCIIRSFADTDIEDFSKYRNNFEWMKFQGFKCRSREEYERVLLRQPNFKEGCQLAIVNQSTEKLIGDLFIKQTDFDFWIGYTISPEYARQGYIFEALSTMIRYIKIIGGKKIMADVDFDNIPSKTLLLKLNFKLLKASSEEEIYYLNLE